MAGATVQHFGYLRLIFRARRRPVYIHVNKKVDETQVHDAPNVLCSSNMCWRNPLVTLGVSDRSHCGALTILILPAQPSQHVVPISDRSPPGAVRILRWLAQPARHFVRVGSLALWCRADFS